MSPVIEHDKHETSVCKKSVSFDYCQEMQLNYVLRYDDPCSKIYSDRLCKIL